MIKQALLLAVAGAALTLAAPGAYAQAKSKAKAPAPPPPAPAAAPAAPASSVGEIGAGDTELNFFGTLSDSDALGTTITVGVGFGKYMNDNMLFKLTQTLTVVDSDALSLFSYAPYGSLEYQIRPDPGSPLVLYAGGGGGISLTTIDIGGFGDFFTYSIFVTPVGGVKYFLDERTSLTYSLSYQFPLLEETCGDVDCVDSDTTTLQNFLGFSIYF